MKKLIAGLLGALLMASGLVALASGSATAARCPYTGCIRTDVTAKAVSPKPGKVRVKYQVGTAGNATPRGVVRVIVKGNGIFRAKNRHYPRKSRVVFFGIPKGSYSVFVKFIPGRSTTWRRSRQDTTVTVR